MKPLQYHSSINLISLLLSYRLIFIEVPARECFVRLFYRKVDPCLGDEYKLPTIEPTGLDSYVTNDLDPEVSARLLSHPKNNKKQIIHDIETYFLQKTVRQKSTCLVSQQVNSPSKKSKFYP